MHFSHPLPHPAVLPLVQHNEPGIFAHPLELEAVLLHQTPDAEKLVCSP